MCGRGFRPTRGPFPPQSPPESPNPQNAQYALVPASYFIGGHWLKEFRTDHENTLKSTWLAFPLDLAHRHQPRHRLRPAGDDHVRSPGRALDQPGEVRLRFVDCD